MRNVVTGLFVAAVLSACGGGDQEPQPEPVVRTAVQNPQLPPPAGS